MQHGNSCIVNFLRENKTGLNHLDVFKDINNIKLCAISESSI